MVARVKAASKFATKSTVQPAEHVTAEPVVERSTAYGDLREGLEALGFTLPSKTRVLLSVVASFLVTFTTTYFGCAVAEWLALGALFYSGSAFLSLLVLVLGYCIAMYVGYKAGMLACKFVSDFSTEAVSSAAASVQLAARRKVSLVRGWFVRNDRDTQYDNVGAC